MAKPDPKLLASLVARNALSIKQDLTTAKPTDVYYMNLEGNVSLEKPFVAELALPSGDFIVVAQAVLDNNDTTAHYFATILSYPENAKTVSDVRGGRLASTLNGLPHCLLLNCAMSSDAKEPVKFHLMSDAEQGFSAGEIKITAVRVGSLTTFLKSF